MSGVESRHEIKIAHQIVDVRPLSTRVGEWMGVWLNFAGVTMGLWVLTVFAPAAAFLTLPAIGVCTLMFVVLRQNLPYRYPADRKDEKGKEGDGICYLGYVDEKSGYEKFKEIWLSDKDLRTHFFILATTGAGKSEALKAIFFNALNWSGGYFIADGKADNQMAVDNYTMVRSRGRDYDYLCLNFLLAGKTPEQAKRARRRRTNGINPFSVADSDTIIQMGANLMPKVEGEAKMWQEKGLNLWRAEVTALCYKRDTQGFNISVTTFLDYMALPKLEQLYMEGYREAEARGGVWSYGFLGIKSYLEAGLPGFKIDRLLRKNGIETAGPPGGAGTPMRGMGGMAPPMGANGKPLPTEQETQAYEQHSYRTNQLMPVLGLLDKTYGYIFQNKFSEIDMTDVVLRRRILTMMIPSLEKSAAEAENLGKLAIACLRVMMARNLGSEVEGTAEELLERKATKAPYPFPIALDELGYYFSDGLAVMFAQARSLGAQMIAAAQDVEMLMSGSRGAEAGAMLANVNAQFFGKLGDTGKTAEVYQKALGEVTVALKRDYQIGAAGYNRTADVAVEKIQRASTNDLRGLDQGEAYMTYAGVVRRMKWFFMGKDNEENRVPYFQINRFLQVEPPTPDEIMANSVPVEQLNDPYERGRQLVQRLAEPLDPFEHITDNPVIAAIAKAAHSMPANVQAAERGIALYMAAREALLAQQAHAQAQPVAARSQPAPLVVNDDPEDLVAQEDSHIAAAVNPDTPVDPLAFLNGNVPFERKKTEDVIGIASPTQSGSRVLESISTLGGEPERLQRDINAVLDPFEAMVREGKSLSIEDMQRRSRQLGEVLGVGGDARDPTSGELVDSRADWIAGAFADLNRMQTVKPAADDTVVGLTKRTLEEVEDAEAALGSTAPRASALAAEKVVASRLTPPTSAQAPIDKEVVEQGMNHLDSVTLDGLMLG